MQQALEESFVKQKVPTKISALEYERHGLEVGTPALVVR
jgi:hypothetical protein